MEDKILLKADLKRHKGSLIGVFTLVLLVCGALCTVLSVWINSGRYIRTEMERAGFGTLTAWVSNAPGKESPPHTIPLSEGDGDLPLRSAEMYDQDSDSEGQLIPYGAEENRYRFFEDSLSGYREGTPEIRPGEIYVSPSMVTMFGVGIGDEISFPVTRGGQAAYFTVKGFYEDPFMGSSMIWYERVSD